MGGSLVNRRLLGIQAGALVMSASALCAQWPLTPQVRLTPPSTAYEEWVACAADQAGRFGVVYEEFHFTPEGYQYSDLVVQFLSSSASPLTPPVTVSEFAAGGVHAWPSIALHRTGTGYVAESRPRIRCVDSTGALTCDLFDLGGLVADQLLAGSAPGVSVRGDGSPAFAWRAGFSSGDAIGKIVASTIDPLVGSEGSIFVVDDEAVTSDSSFPPELSVAALPEGRLVVVWSDLGADGAGEGILGQIFESDGTAVASSFIVNSHAPGNQLAPDVAADAAGRFVVVWDSTQQDGYAEGVYGQRFDATGNRLGGEFQISSSYPSAQLEPDVAMDAAGNFAVTWLSYTEPSEYFAEVYLRAYRQDGSAIGPQVWASEGIDNEEQRRPAIALSDAGVLLVAAVSDRFDPDTGEWGEDVVGRFYALPCEADATSLCLGEGGRFRVRAFHRTAIGLEGPSRAVPLTTDSGGFWFFSPDNFELLVKALDGCEINGNFWIYAAGLTDVEVDLIVTDSWTGTVQVYRNELGGAYVPVQRVSDFATCDAPPPTGAPLGSSRVSAAPSPLVAAATADEATGECVDSETQLCLTSERFLVTAEWEAPAWGSGSGHALPWGSDSGLFWFFDPANLDLAVKVLDGCGVNDRFWVYAAGLTNVRVRLRVEDMATGAVWVHENPLGTEFPAVLDSSALDICP